MYVYRRRKSKLVKVEHKTRQFTSAKHKQRRCSDRATDRRETEEENIEEEITINPDLQMQEINFGGNTSTKF